MTSSSEQLYQHFNWRVWKRASKLRRDLAFVILALIALRLGSFIPLPGTNTALWSEFWVNSPFSQFTLLP